MKNSQVVIDFGILMEGYVAYPENITVSSHDSPLMEGHPEDLLCVWCEGSITRMEWLFLGNSIIVPMEYTNRSWDGEMFTCMAATYDGIEHVESITLEVKGTLCYHLCSLTVYLSMGFVHNTMQ